MLFVSVGRITGNDVDEASTEISSAGFKRSVSSPEIDQIVELDPSLNETAAQGGGRKEEIRKGEESWNCLIAE